MEKKNVSLEELGIFIKSWIERANKENELIKTFRRNIYNKPIKCSFTSS